MPIEDVHHSEDANTRPILPGRRVEAYPGDGHPGRYFSRTRPVDIVVLDVYADVEGNSSVVRPRDSLSAGGTAIRDTVLFHGVLPRWFIPHLATRPLAAAATKPLPATQNLIGLASVVGTWRVANRRADFQPAFLQITT